MHVLVTYSENCGKLSGHVKYSHWEGPYYQFVAADTDENANCQVLYTCKMPEELLSGIKSIPECKDLQGNVFVLKEQDNTTPA